MIHGADGKFSIGDPSASGFNTTPDANLEITPSNTGRQFHLGDWFDVGESTGGHGGILGNARLDRNPSAFKYSNTHASIGAVGFMVNYPAWNKASVITSGTTASTAGNTFTPTRIATFLHTGRVGSNTDIPARRLDIIDASNPQLRLSHTAGSVFCDIQSESDGDVSIEPSGDNINIIDKNLLFGTATGTQIGTATTQKLAFYGSTPIVQPAAYTLSNVNADRGYDADATTLDEIADVLGTLISDLQNLGLIG